MPQNRFCYLLARKLSGEALPAEVAELEQLMKDHPDWIYSAEHVEALWKLSCRDQDLLDAELAFDQHLNRNKGNGLYFPELDTPVPYQTETEAPASPKRRWIMNMALVAIATALTAGLLWLQPGNTKSSYNQSFSEVFTRPGSKTRLVLPDSSVVWLNAGSKLTYNHDFGINSRTTKLTGEAFFEVKKGAVPFTIQANGIMIKVMGTAFNVKSYPNEKTTETSLIRGEVEVTLDRRPGEKFILKPNEKLIVSNEMEAASAPAAAGSKKEPMVVLGLLSRTEDETVVETSWVDNKLVFQDESFSEIARKMERWFNVSIEIRDEHIKNMRLTGTFRDETVLDALKALQIAFPFEFSIQDSRIIISGK